MSSTLPKNFKAILKVKRKTYITPHFIRVFFTGQDIPLIANTTVGVNNKIFIPPTGVDTIHFPDYDYQKQEWIHPPEDLKPTVRTYTHRGIDLEKNEAWIDFVAHGEEGPASAWAIRAKEGDVLGVSMHNGKATLYPEALTYLLVGDATAIPVLSAILEDLPAEKKAICIIEVHGKEDEQILKTSADVTLIWLHNETPQNGSALADKVKTISLPTASKFAYIAAEYATVKEIRSYLRQEKQWQKEELYAYSYWKSGTAEDKSTKDRQQEKNSIA